MKTPDRFDDKPIWKLVRWLAIAFVAFLALGAVVEVWQGLHHLTLDAIQGFFFGLMIGAGAMTIFNGKRSK
jgi:hypothetical protein